MWGEVAARSSDDQIIWGTSMSDDNGDQIIWGTQQRRRPDHLGNEHPDRLRSSLMAATGRALTIYIRTVYVRSAARSCVLACLPAARPAPARMVGVRGAVVPHGIVHHPHRGDRSQPSRSPTRSSSVRCCSLDPKPRRSPSRPTAACSRGGKHGWSAGSRSTRSLRLFRSGRRGRAFFYLAASRRCRWHGDVPMGSLSLPALMCLAAIYFALNSGLMAVAVGLNGGQSPLRIWQTPLPVAVASATSPRRRWPFCLVLIVQQVGLGVAAIVILPVLAVLHRTLQRVLRPARGRASPLKQMSTVCISRRSKRSRWPSTRKTMCTHSHVRRVQTYAVGMARALGNHRRTDASRPSKPPRCFTTPANSAVPEHILNKPGGLTPAEFEQMKRHVDIGADILSLVDFPFPVVPIVRCHHENWDGTGYPRGVAGEDIPIGARILSVVDCFDALDLGSSLSPSL